jgi:hypothetical protein
MRSHQRLAGFVRLTELSALDIQFGQPPEQAKVIGGFPELIEAFGNSPGN